MSRYRRWLYPLLALALYALAGFLLAPWLVERTLRATLEERLALKTELDGLAINPFTLSLKVDGLNLSDADGTHLLGFERLFVNFELSSLFRWAVSFNEVHLIRPEVTLERFAAADTNISRLIDAWAASAEPDGTPEPAPDQTENAGLFRLVIADLRIVDGKLTAIDQMPVEPFTTELAPIDLSIADFSTLPDASGQQQVTISTESGATAAMTGTLSVNPLALTGSITVAGTYTPMLFRYFRNELALPVSFDGGELDLALRYSVRLDDSGELSADITDLGGTLNGLLINQPDHPPLAQMGSFSVAGGRLEWPAQIVHIDDIQFDSVVVDAYRDADGLYLPASESSAASEFIDASEFADASDNEPISDIAANAAGEEVSTWQLSADRLRLSGWQLSHTDSSLESATLRISELSFELRDLSNADGQQMTWQLDAVADSGGTVAASGTLQALPELRVDANLTTTSLSLAPLQAYLNAVANIGIEQGNLSLAGSLSSSPDQAFRYAGNFRIDNLQLVDRAQEEDLLTWQALVIDQLQLTPTGLEISEIVINAPYARIEIEQDGSTNIERTLLPEDASAAAKAPAAAVEAPAAATKAPAAAAKEPDTPESAPFQLTVAKSLVTDASARFTDLALPLPFEASISNLAGSLSTLSSTSSQPARLDLEGQVNEYGHLVIGGTLQPFAVAAKTDVAINFKNVNLPRMSPYTIKFAGRKIDDGRTDLELVYKLNEGQLDGYNRLVIHDLTLGEKVPHPDAMDLPLDLAVALMKDPNGVVDFNFPVNGALGDPEFSYGGAVGKAFSNLILGLATSPFRLLGSLVGLGAEEMESVAFLPGRTDLTPPQREVLDQLAAALAQRPQLLLSVPPVIDPIADRQALQTARIDEEIEQRLAEAAVAEDNQQALLEERRRRIVEDLFDEVVGGNRAELKALHSPLGEQGEPVFDPPAYTAALRTALIEQTDISVTDLSQLANERADAVIYQLTVMGALPDERVSKLEVEESAIGSDGTLEVELEISTAE